MRYLLGLKNVDPEFISGIVDSARSVVYDQAEKRLYAKKAALIQPMGVL